jgi:hypothetical protein
VGPFDAPCGCDRFWASANYTLSWIRSERLATPLVTTGSAADLHPGALDQPGTVVLLGDHMNFGSFSGIRGEVGAFLDEDDHFSLELGGWIVFPEHSTFSLNSDAGGNPIITRPIFNLNAGREAAFLDAFPGVAAGGVAVDVESKLWGAEVNSRYHWCPCEHLRADALLGFRYLRLEESLTVNDHLSPLENNVLRFQGAFVNPPNSLADFDRFHSDDYFYGMQVGGGVRWDEEWFFVGAFGKAAFGATHQTYDINGATTLITPGGNQTATGGILALPTNIGQHDHTVFGFVPEVGLNVGFKVSPHVDLTAGYSFLYWNQVARPGDTLDRNVNTSQVPTDISFGQGGGQARPVVRFNGDSFWVSTLTFGVDVHF